MFKKIEFTLNASLEETSSTIFILITHIQKNWIYIEGVSWRVPQILYQWHVKKIWIYIKSIFSRDTFYNSTKSNLY